MNAEVQIALIVAAPPTVAALGAIVVAVIHDRRAGKKMDAITVATNGTATRMQSKVDGLEILVRQLLVEKTVAETKIDVAAAVPDTPAATS